MRKGRVQRYLRCSCGHRFSDSKVKVNILKQSCVLPDAVHDFGDLDLVKSSFGEIGFQNTAFTIGKDISSHVFPRVGKTIYKFLHACACSRHTVFYSLQSFQSLLRLSVSNIRGRTFPSFLGRKNFKSVGGPNHDQHGACF